jgi:hypothetical protein
MLGIKLLENQGSTHLHESQNNVAARTPAERVLTKTPIRALVVGSRYSLLIIGRLDPPSIDFTGDSREAMTRDARPTSKHPSAKT